MTLATTLRAGRPVLLLTVSEVRNPNLAVMLKTAGMDGFFLDMEHATYNWSDMAAMVAVARAVDLYPIVRVPEIRRETILKPLDAGASGLLIPMVEEVEQVREIVSFMKYPPDGDRGAALRRPHAAYRKVDDAGAYLAKANEEDTTVVLQIETKRAIENLDALFSVSGVDAAYVGPFDLSVSMGCPGQPWADEMLEAYRTLIDAGKRHGVATGMQFAKEFDRAAEFIAEGMQLVSLGSDVGHLVDQSAHAVRQVHRRLAKEK